MEKYYLSLDISTTNIGFSLWSDDGKLIELKHLELKIDKKVSVDDRDMIKADKFKNYIVEYRKHITNDLNGDVCNIAIEAPLPASNNIDTVLKLASFNGVCRYILYKEFGIIPFKISVHDSRLAFLVDMVKIKKEKGNTKGVLSFPKGWKSDEKKRYIQQKVAKLEPQITWFYHSKTSELLDINWDLSDSYVIGIAFFLHLGIISKEDWKVRYNSFL
jgi:hypothetical protein